MDVDTSSYPKPPALPAQKTMLEVAGQLGTLQQQKLQIDQAKLDQANQALGYMTRAMGSLGPNASKQDYAKVGQNAVDMGLVPQDKLDIYMQRLQAAPDAQSFYNEFTTAAAGHQQQIDYHLGRVGTSENGQTVTPTVVSPKPGFGQRPIGLPVQQQAPPSATGYDTDGQPRTLGAQPPQLAPGTVAQPTPLPASRPSLPVQRPGPAMPGPVTSPAIQGPSANFGGSVVAANVEPTTFNNRFPQPAGVAAGPPPMFEEGKKALMEDQANATQKMTAVKPAIMALKLLPGLRSGPGTEPFNKAVAFLKANNIISTDQENDKTVIYQEANKYLSQYLKGRGGRSDADLAAAEKSSPGVGVQLNPALVNLTKSAVAQDMMEAARPNAFTSANRKDFQNYGAHRSTFPQSMDQRAFEAAIMPEKERNALVQKYIAKYKKNPADPEANKFLNSIHAAEKAGMFNTESE